MSKKIEVTRWSPDTCDCKIVFQVDHSKTPEGGEPIVEFVRFDNVCDVHAQIKDEQERWDEINSENRMKNHTLVEIMNNFPELAETITKPNGNQYRDLKAGIKYEWAFDENRNLKVRLAGANISPNKKEAINRVLKQKYPNKVEVLREQDAVPQELKFNR